MLLNFAIAEDVAADAQALGRALQSAAAGLCELSLRFFESGDAPPAYLHHRLRRLYLAGTPGPSL